MMLQALYALSERERLMEDPDYQWKRIAWLIRLDPRGTLLNIESTKSVPSADAKGRKPKPVARYFSVPREPERTSGDRAFFLGDKSEYVFGIDPMGKRSREKLSIRFELFRDRAVRCFEATHDPGVEAVIAFLDRMRERYKEPPMPDGTERNDLFAFVFDPDIDRLVTDRDRVREFWANERLIADESGLRPFTCLVTGDTGLLPAGFPKTKGVPGANTSGGTLVSFNANAFESHGWNGSENAPISRRAAEACSTALTRLLEGDYPDPRDPRTYLPRRRYYIGDDTVLCYWSESRAEFESAFAGFLDGDIDIDAVPERYRSIWSGRPSSGRDVSGFFVMVLAGAEGRLVVRDWFESTIELTERSLAQHFADLDIVRNAVPSGDRQQPVGFPLRVLFEAIASPSSNRKAGVPAPLATEILRAGLSGKRYPLAALQRALNRYRAELGNEGGGLDGWKTRQWNDARAAIIKAVVNRNSRFRKDHEEVTIAMDPTNTQPGYLLGRLMGVVERMQQSALGNVNASVVDRYFGAASATPVAVFPRLLKQVRHHASKAKDDSQNAATARWLEGQIDDIVSSLEGFPVHLNLEQQGLFVIGYHHQRHWLWMKKEDRQAWTTKWERPPDKNDDLTGEG